MKKIHCIVVISLFYATASYAAFNFLSLSDARIMAKGGSGAANMNTEISPFISPTGLGGIENIYVSASGLAHVVDISQDASFAGNVGAGYNLIDVVKVGLFGSFYTFGTLYQEYVVLVNGVYTPDFANVRIGANVKWMGYTISGIDTIFYSETGNGSGVLDIDLGIATSFQAFSVGIFVYNALMSEYASRDTISVDQNWFSVRLPVSYEIDGNTFDIDLLYSFKQRSFNVSLGYTRTFALLDVMLGVEFVNLEDTINLSAGVSYSLFSDILLHYAIKYSTSFAMGSGQHLLATQFYF